MQSFFLLVALAAASHALPAATPSDGDEAGGRSHVTGQYHVETAAFGAACGVVVLFLLLALCAKAKPQTQHNGHAKDHVVASGASRDMNTTITQNEVDI